MDRYSVLAVNWHICLGMRNNKRLRGILRGQRIECQFFLFELNHIYDVFGQSLLVFEHILSHLNLLNVYE